MSILIVVGAFLSLVVGSVWYGPLFGKKWMEIIGATSLDVEKRKEMQKAAMPLYVIQFGLTLLQLYVFTNFIAWNELTKESVWVAFFMWVGYVVPTLAGNAMWNNNPPKVKMAMFLIQAGYQLVMFLLYGYMVATWG
jgi:hypothetical protein